LPDAAAGGPAASRNPFLRDRRPGRLAAAVCLFSADDPVSLTVSPVPLCGPRTRRCRSPADGVVICSGVALLVGGWRVAVGRAGLGGLFEGAGCPLVEGDAV
jgi:hypothetical protein